jgi:hypothetical protein
MRAIRHSGDIPAALAPVLARVGDFERFRTPPVDEDDDFAAPRRVEAAGGRRGLAESVGSANGPRPGPVKRGRKPKSKRVCRDENYLTVIPI